jgi:DNA polymerase III subunit gamma/tau
MGQALYRKYRSKHLDEIIGQEHITDTLNQALKSGRISHAYLFTGPRGVGKTSIARILAHEINDLPYEDDSSHIDIIEIDAASNRRIDEIRDLRDKVYVAPTSAKYKVYIIDEVHMLTREAFNALLKTLEEPPAHVVFILATTDAHKLPETIVSRTQRFTFKPVDKPKVVEHLKDIAKKEKLEVEEAALELLAEHGEGSFRDSISLLDQASSHGQSLTLAQVQTLLGIPSEDGINRLLQALAASDQAMALTMQALGDLYDQGFQATMIAKRLSAVLREQLVNGKNALGTSATLALLERLLDVASANNPERFLEIVLLKSLPAPTEGMKKPSPQAKAIAPEPKAQEEPEPELKAPAIIEDVIMVAEEVSEETAITHSKLDEAAWPEVLAALKQKYNTLYGVVRMAQPDFSTPGNLELAFAFAFHQKRINDAKNRQIISDIIKRLTGTAVHINCVVNEDAKPLKVASTPIKDVVAPPKADLSTISNIFGSAELLES